MSNLYNWKIINLEVLPESNGRQNVVHKIQWVLSVSDGVNSFSMGDSTDIPYDPNSDFIEYKNLSEEEALTWVHNNLGSETVTQYQNNIDEILLSMPQPETKLTLPWIN